MPGLWSDEFIQRSDVGEFQQPGFSWNGLSWNGMEELEMGSSSGLQLKLHLPLVLPVVASLDHQGTGSDIWDTNSITMSHVFSCDQDFPILSQL